MKYIIIAVRGKWKDTLTFLKNYNPPTSYAMLTDDLFDASVYSYKEIRPYERLIINNENIFKIVPITTDAFEALGLPTNIDFIEAVKHLNSK